MKYDKVSLENTGIVNSLVWDYINDSPKLKPFIVDFPQDLSITNFLDKQKFEYINRAGLTEEILRQYEKFEFTDSVRNNIFSLSKENSYTICTGHQLCLFTGPAYFFYKIISVIKQSKNLNKKFPNKKFVPVFWMATEDHDFEEINQTFLFGKKILWETNQHGRVGEFNLDGLESTLNHFKEILGDTDVSRYVTEIFSNALKNTETLAEFTRHFLNEIFGKYGLVIIDGNSSIFKSLFIEEMQAELFQSKGWKYVNENSEKLEKLKYAVQVSPREINLFYCIKGLRERIVWEGKGFKVLNTDLFFSEEEIKNLLKEHPERFSPNVVLRPLYQQKLLPNLFYIGGPSEISYWFQLKSFFDSSYIHFPFLKLRDFACVLDSKSIDKWANLGFELVDYFKDDVYLSNKWMKIQSYEVSLNDFEDKANVIFNEIKIIADNADHSLIGSVDSERQKLLNGISNLEKKINRVLKQKNESSLKQIPKLKSRVFPEGIFQERKENFFALINGYGLNFLDELIESVDDEINYIKFLTL